MSLFCLFLRRNKPVVTVAARLVFKIIAIFDGTSVHIARRLQRRHFLTVLPMMGRCGHSQPLTGRPPASVMITSSFA